MQPRNQSESNSCTASACCATLLPHCECHNSPHAVVCKCGTGIKMYAPVHSACSSVLAQISPQVATSSHSHTQLLHCCSKFNAQHGDKAQGQKGCNRWGVEQGHLCSVWGMSACKPPHHMSNDSSSTSTLLHCLQAAVQPITAAVWLGSGHQQQRWHCRCHVVTSHPCAHYAC
jgi:hypothetical protein